MSDDHEWCRDVRRDEAVRAAEDAAAVPSIQHRDLPEVVAELRERVGNIEALVGKAAVAGVFDGVGVPPSPATRTGETTAKHPVPPAEGLRTERVTLEIAQRADIYKRLSEINWGAMWRATCGSHVGESVRVVEEPAEIALLTAERDLARAVRDALRSKRDAVRDGLRSQRDAAIRERDEARARVAELEAAAPPRGWLTEEEREAVEEAMVDYGSNVGDSDCERIERVLRALLARSTPTRVPPPPRGWLTEEERELIAGLTDDDVFTEEGQNIAKALLARSTPPRVKVPHLDDLEADERPVWQSACEAWIAAIRAAGGEVEG